MAVYLDNLRNYAQGFKLPDFSKLWSSQDQTDGGQPQTPLAVKLEYFLVRYQELALWKDPKSSAVALTLIHLVFGYLASTTNTTLNLTVWLVLSGFVYTTWVNKIWPEIRVEEPHREEDRVPIDPNVFSAPELAEIMNLVRNKFNECFLKARELRSREPGMFCLMSTVVFLILIYIGTFVSALGLLYYTVVGSFVIPGILKVMGHHPKVQSFIRDNLKTTKELKEKRDEADVSRVSDMVQSMCSTLQSGVAALQATLPEMSQLQKQKSELTSPQEVKEDDLKPYMPSMDDEASQQILERCASHGEHGPTQVESLHQDESGEPVEYNSLIEGLNMPGHDEIDHQSTLTPSESSSIHHNSEISQDLKVRTSDLEAEKSVEEEFLPSTSDTLLLSQTIDEMESRQGQKTKDTHGRETLSLGDEEDDFELISAEELKRHEMAPI